jgi:hypothetical protein
MNRTILKSLATVLTCWLLFGAVAVIAGSALVMESYTGETEIILYIKGIEGDAANATVQTGTEVCKDVQTSSLAEEHLPMQTLILLDNSKSIPKEARKNISEIMQNIISDRVENEQIAIATFDKSVNYLTEFTSDYTELKNAVNGIEYEKKSIYLTDVIYDLLSEEYISAENDVFRRIIVISDGIDSKSIGYTNDELYSLIKENPFPIYTIGVNNGDNDERLENLFAISRASKADSFLLDDMDNLLDINTALNEDRNIIRFTIFPADEQLDGSKKMIKITLVSGESISAEVKMPQPEIVKVNNEDNEEDTSEEPLVDNKPDENNSSITGTIVIAAGACLVVLAVIIVVVVLLVRKRKQDDFEHITDDALNQFNNMQPDDDRKTEMIDVNSPMDDGSTLMIWNTGNLYDVILTDVDSAARSFQAPLQNSIVVGRKQGKCDITIDYDKSISGEHCEIRTRDGKFYIVDLQSTNHTYVNDSLVLSEVEIFPGDIITLGRIKLKFEIR